MRWLAQIVMKGRIQAIMSVTVLAILSLLLAPLSMLSGSAAALVTMRHGAQEGMLVISASSVASGILSYLLFADMMPAIVFILVLWLPVWLLGSLLRYSRSLALVIQATLAISVLVIGYFYLFIGNPSEFWSSMIREPLQMFVDSGQLDTSAQDFDEILASLSSWMTAIMATGFFLQMVVVIFIARWWQAVLYNPGGFGEEFRQMSYHRGMTFLAAPVLLWVLLGDPPEWLIAVAMLMMVAYFLLGLAVTHALLKRINANVVWITGIYVLLLIAMPYVMTALAMTGFTDSWMNFRKNHPSSKEGD
jgi:hypothetical protein